MAAGPMPSWDQARLSVPAMTLNLGGELAGTMSRITFALSLVRTSSLPGPAAIPSTELKVWGIRNVVTNIGDIGDCMKSITRTPPSSPTKTLLLRMAIAYGPAKRAVPCGPPLPATVVVEPGTPAAVETVAGAPSVTMRTSVVAPVHHPPLPVT